MKGTAWRLHTWPCVNSTLSLKSHWRSGGCCDHMEGRGSAAGPAPHSFATAILAAICVHLLLVSQTRKDDILLQAGTHIHKAACHNQFAGYSWDNFSEMAGELHSAERNCLQKPGNRAPTSSHNPHAQSAEFGGHLWSAESEG